jgi:hypothetical protein
MNCTAFYTDEYILLQCTGKQITAHNKKQVHYVFVLDSSGSMEEDNKFSNCVASIAAAFNYIRPDDNITIITFNHAIRVIVKNQKATDTMKARIMEKLYAEHPEGKTNISDTIEYVGTILSDSDDERQCLIFLTDGYPTSGERSYDALASVFDGLMSLSPSLTVSAIGYGTDHNAHFLKYIAQEGGGTYSIVENLMSVASVFGYIIASATSIVATNVRISSSWLIPLTAYPLIKRGKVNVGNIAAEQTVLILYRRIPVKVPQLTIRGALEEDDSSLKDILTLERMSYVSSDYAAMEYTINVELMRNTIYNFMRNISDGEIRGASLVNKRDELLRTLSNMPPGYDVNVFIDEVKNIHPLKCGATYTQRSLCIGLNKGVRIMDGSAVIQSPTPTQRTVVESILMSVQTDKV